MFRKVYKYDLGFNGPGKYNVTIPLPAEIVHFGLDPNGYICIWAEVNPDSDPQSIELWVYGTGQAISDWHQHIATCNHNQYMWHLYKTRPPLELVEKP